MNTNATTTTSAAAAAPSIAPAAPAGAHAKSWLVEFVLLAAIWGASFLFMRAGAKELGVFATSGLRVAIAALFLLPIVLLRGHGPSLRQHWKLTFVVGILNSAIPFACFSFALLSITTGLSSILNATTPLFGAVIAWLWLKDRPTGSRAVGLLIGFAGVALLAWDKASFKPDASGTATGWAVLACLLATLCYSIAASFTKRYMSGLPSLVSATGSQIGAAIGLVPLAWWFWPEHAVSLNAWLTVIALGVLCTGVAYILYFRLIERAGPARALSVTFAIPVFALLYGVLLLGEEVTTWMLVCGVVIVVGTSLSTGLVRFSRKWHSGETWGTTNPRRAAPSGFSPLGGSDPRSGGAWGQQFAAGPPQGKLTPLGLMAAAPGLPAQGGTARRDVDSGNAAACKACDPRSGGAWGPI